MLSCADQLIRWRTDLDTFHPDVVLLAEGEYEVRNQLVGKTWTHIGEPAFDASERTALSRAVTVLHSTGATVVLLTAPDDHQLEQPDGAPWPEDDPARRTPTTTLRTVAADPKGSAVVADLNARLDPGRHYDQTVDGIDARFADGISRFPSRGRHGRPVVALRSGHAREGGAGCRGDSGRSDDHHVHRADRRRRNRSGRAV